MTYQPTDEQIVALSYAEAEVYQTAAIDKEGTAGFVTHPAFQSIIRAAQAEALRRLIELRPNPMWPVGMYGAPQAMYGSRQIDRWMEAADPNPYREAPTA